MVLKVARDYLTGVDHLVELDAEEIQPELIQIVIGLFDDVSAVVEEEPYVCTIILAYPTSKRIVPEPVILRAAVDVNQSVVMIVVEVIVPIL